MNENNNAKRCVIVGGADIEDYGRIRSSISENDYFVFCDSGLKHVQPLGVKPSLIVGDFDSHEDPQLDIETIVLPCEKDDTDTVYGVKQAIARGLDEYLLIGVIGARIDHTLGNVSILLYLDSLGKKGRIIDDYSELEVVSNGVASIDDSYAFFSLLSISGKASGITIRGAKYPLENGDLTCEYQYCISNEVLKGETAKVSVKEGRLLLVKVFRQ